MNSDLSSNIQVRSSICFRASFVFFMFIPMVAYMIGYIYICVHLDSSRVNTYEYVYVYVRVQYIGKKYSRKIV
jgi:hypothetical protein